MSGLPVMTLLAAPAAAPVSGLDRGRAVEATGTRFGVALALAARELPLVEVAGTDDSTDAPARGSESTDAPTLAAGLTDSTGGGASDVVGPPLRPASAPVLLADAPQSGVAVTPGPSAVDVGAPAVSGEGAAPPSASAAADSSITAESVASASAAGEVSAPRSDAAPARATASATAASLTAGPRATPVAPDAFQPTAPERPSNPPQLPTVPPTLAPREAAEAGETGPGRVTHAVPAVAPPGASVSAAPPVEASGSSAAAPRAVAAQISPAVIAIAQRPSGTHQLTMTVHPESLGPVTVRAHISAGGDVQVELLGATDAGRDALRAIVADLRRDLAAVMPNASLSLASNMGGEAGSHDRGAQPGVGERTGDQPGSGAQRSGAETAPRAAAGTSDRSVPTTAHAASGAGLDIFV